MVSKFWPKIIGARAGGCPQEQSLHYPPSISIQLLEPNVYTHPGSNPVLRGVVGIECKRPIVITSLHLDFRGSLDYRLAKLDISGQKEFAQCSLPLYPPPASPPKPLDMHSPIDAPTRFVFEMPLPNRNHDPGADQESLIQSIRCNEFHVKYHIRAILQYETQTEGKKKKKLVVIQRSRPQPVTIVHIPTFDDSSTYFTSDNMHASIDSRKQTNHWCQYRVQVDKRFAAISSMLSLSIRIAPLIQGLKLGQASMHIVQRFTITQTSQTFSRPPIPLLCVFQSTPYPSSESHHTGGTLYEGDFHYMIPSNANSTTSIHGLVPSMKASNITIDHHLVVHITLTYPKVSHDGILRRARRVLTFKSDFDLLHSFMAQPDEMLRLPAYDTAVGDPSSLAIEFLQTCQSLPPVYDQALLVPPTLLR